MIYSYEQNDEQTEFIFDVNKNVKDLVIGGVYEALVTYLDEDGNQKDVKPTNKVFIQIESSRINKDRNI